MYPKSDNVEILINDEIDEVIEELVKPSQNKYQNNLEESMQGSEFVIDYVHLFYYKFHKIIQIMVDHIQILLIE